MALVIGLFALATGRLLVGCAAVILAAVLGVASGVWVLHSHRSVRDAELRWHEANSAGPAPPPSS